MSQVENEDPIEDPQFHNRIHLDFLSGDLVLFGVVFDDERRYQCRYGNNGTDSEVEVFDTHVLNITGKSFCHCCGEGQIFTNGIGEGCSKSFVIQRGQLLVLVICGVNVMSPLMYCCLTNCKD